MFSKTILKSAEYDITITALRDHGFSAFNLHYWTLSSEQYNLQLHCQQFILQYR